MYVAGKMQDAGDYGIMFLQKPWVAESGVENSLSAFSGNGSSARAGELPFPGNRLTEKRAEDFLKWFFLRIED
ncbi:hypothetical protein HMPREF3038_01556 [Akkermansia sp. KLE1797]|jgi:hypothetical protein|nr:hypothetical protein HMPREF3038_01556 [Akkermansia sp. KLE1797]KXU54045.1 hypothetical protein HMPREF3039_01710 [Akkermansia sp. KLE1798]KZA05528.1 hypothetical protein HMPREF1326_00703 [Akkermansia sp. KLE1605]